MTTIQESLEKTRERAAAEEAIAHQYPHARLTGMPGGEAWTTKEMIDDATSVTLLGRPHVHIALSVSVEGVKVHHPTYMELSELLHAFERQDPDGYRSLVAFMVKEIAHKP